MNYRKFSGLTPSLIMLILSACSRLIGSQAQEFVCTVELRTPSDLRTIEQQGGRVVRHESNSATVWVDMQTLEWLGKYQFRPSQVVFLNSEELMASLAVSSVSARRSLNSESLLKALASADSDADGLTDTEEIWWLTDPKIPDTDGDGIKDGDEVNRLRRRDRQYGPPFPFSRLSEDNDQDRDSIPDLVERVIGTNPNNESTDGDKYDDGQEYFGTTRSGWGALPLAGEGTKIPAFVDDPGRSPFVAAYPEISIEIIKDTIRVVTKKILFTGHTVEEGQLFEYMTSQTVGQSTTVGQTVTHTVSAWQESGNRQADSEARTRYKENLASSSSESFRAYREGVNTEVETGQSVTATIGTSGEVGATVLGPYAKAEVHAEATANLYATQKAGFETESRSEQRNFLELQKREGEAIQYQRINEVSTTSGVGHETSVSTSISHTTYQEITVGKTREVSKSDSWETATTQDTAHAGDLHFTIRIKNSGTDRALDIQRVRFNIQIGSAEKRELITSSNFPDPPSLEPKKEHSYSAEPVKLTLDQLRAIDLGEPVKIWVEDFDFKDQAFYEAALRDSVLFEIDAGVDDGQEEIERYLMPT